MKIPSDPRRCDVRHVDINRFARSFAGLFDFPRNGDYARCLVRAAVCNKSLESIYQNKGGLPPDSFFHFFKYPVDVVADAMDRLFAGQARLIDRGCVIAVDTNDVEYWGDPDEYVHNKKGLSKNSDVLRYATVSVVDEKHKLTLACLPVRIDDRISDIVKILLIKAKSLVRVDTVLFDRGFYNAEVLRQAESLGMEYVIPVRKTVGMDRVWDENKNKRVKLRYTLNKTTVPHETWLYIEEKRETRKKKRPVKTTGKLRKSKWPEKKEREYVGILSNKDVCSELVDDFMDWYFVRCNIENGYKEKNLYRIKTCSTDKSYRFLTYCISHYLMNLVQITRYVNRKMFRNDEMKELIKLLLEKTLHGEYKLSKTLIVIA